MESFNLDFENSFPTPFANTTILPLILMSLVSQKHAPETTKGPLKLEYDYIVIGSGSAGAVMANRLSEFPTSKVLLLEAGRAAPVVNEIPLFARTFWFTEIDWAYRTVPQKHTGNLLVDRQVVWPSGKALGGTSVLNEMVYVRGSPKNYDDWAAQGAKGWDYESVFPYFLKLEDNRDPEYFANGFHDVGGPITVERPRFTSELKAPVFEAAHQMGYPVVDPNAYSQNGFYDLQSSQRKGQRCSTAKAYLVPAETRRNLDILDEAMVRKILIKNGNAVGVEFDHKGTTYSIGVRREVILSAGAINSAQLLMLSGIGPRSELEKFNIPVVADLPVGLNLQDHCAMPLFYTLDPEKVSSLGKTLMNPKTTQDYIANRTGLLTSTSGVSAIAFVSNDGPNRRDVADNQLYFLQFEIANARREFGLKPEVLEKVFAPYENKTVYACLVSQVHPRSRGTVTLQSADPYDPPAIDPNYFEDPADVEDMVQGMKTCLEFGSSKPLLDIGSKPIETVFPGCESFVENDDVDGYLRCQIKAYIITLSHPVGTVKMGHPHDPTTVVDPELRVKNIRGLRVVDASVMPLVPHGNTNIPTIMLAERAADIIKGVATNYGRSPAY